MFNNTGREWINIYILRKEIKEDDIATIELDVDKTEYIYAYDRYITILCNGKLSIYNSYASKEAELDISISNPIYSSNNNYLTIAEKNGQDIYFISNNKVEWVYKVEGNISKINMSKGGFVTVTMTGSIHKSVVVTLDKNGKELFKTYLASAKVIDTDVSVDGKYLAIGEINTSGAIIESDIKIIDIEKAVNEEQNSVIFIYKAASNKMITDIKYQERGQLVCMYDDSIHIVNNDEDNELVKFGQNTKFADINLKSYIIRAEEKAVGLFKSKTDIILKNIITGVETIYGVDSSIKEIVSLGQVSAVNIGTEIHFINLNGWLEKKYISNQEAKEIVLGTSIAGIVYRDRIKVLTF